MRTYEIRGVINVNMYIFFYEYLCENMGLEDFLTEEDRHVQSPDMEG